MELEKVKFVVESIREAYARGAEAYPYVGMCESLLLDKEVAKELSEFLLFWNVDTKTAKRMANKLLWDYLLAFAAACERLVDDEIGNYLRALEDDYNKKLKERDL